MNAVKRPQYIVAGGTLTGVTISAVDNCSFLDQCPAITRYADDKHIIRIFDSAGRYNEAWCKKQGSGEVLGDSIPQLADLTTGWRTNSCTINSPNQFTLTAASGLVYRSDIITVRRLFKSSFASTESIGGTTILIGNSSEPTYAFDGQSNVYKTSVNALLQIFNIAGGVGNQVTINTLTMQQVLAPSLSGLILRNNSGQQSFNYKHPSFTFNEASYKFQIYSVKAKKTYFIPSINIPIHLFFRRAA